MDMDFSVEAERCEETNKALLSTVFEKLLPSIGASHIRDTSHETTPRPKGLFRRMLRKLWRIRVGTVLFVGLSAGVGLHLQAAEFPNDAAENDTWVEMAYCGAKPHKPPLEKLFFDVYLHNQRQEPTWVLLPLGYYEQANSYNKDAGVEAIEVLEDKIHQVKLIKFLGRFRVLPHVATDAGGFQAVLLPRGSEVFVHNLVIDFWGRPNGPLPITAVMARRIIIGGKTVEHRVGARLESKTSTAEHFALADSWHTVDWREVPAVITRTGQFFIRDVLATRCQPKAQ